MLSQILEHIEASGPMPFDVFMEMCLYDENHGFFAAGRGGPGATADFVTAPEISPLFGTLVGEWAKARIRDDWIVVEIGGGTGALLGPMLGVVGGIDTYVIERSRPAREGIIASIPGTKAVRSIGEIAAKGAVVVMNEVLDNIPAAIVRRTPEGWIEVAVGADDGSLCLVDLSVRPEVASWASEHIGSVPVGTVASVQLRASDLVAQVFEAFDEVALVVFDYGGVADELAARPPGEVVRTYRRQRTGFDYLRHPGETDITVDVNTDAVASVATTAGADVESQLQSDFLRSLGAQETLDRLKQQEIACAKAGDVMGQLKARSDGLALRALLDPAGFGGFAVVTAERISRVD
ncbi:MAG: SAM-dependent methyltransferase [Acidimicrobiia bacterium]